MPGIDARAFWGFLGSANIAPAIKRRMEAAIRAALELPAVRARVLKLGINLDLKGQDVFRPFHSRPIATRGQLVRENNIRPA